MPKVVNQDFLKHTFWSKGRAFNRKGNFFQISLEQCSQNLPFVESRYNYKHIRNKSFLNLKKGKQLAYYLSYDRQGFHNWSWFRTRFSIDGHHKIMYFEIWEKAKTWNKSRFQFDYFAMQHWEDEGQFKFYCHFGPEECTGNKIHACSIKYITNQHKLADYIHCMIRYNGQLTRRAEQCSQTHQVPWEDIYNCSKVTRDYDISRKILGFY